MPKILSTEEFIERARQVHGDKYDYSQTKYKNSTTKVCIICKTHGEFWQIPKNHLKGCECQKCSNVYVMSQEQFIEKAIQVHGDKYDYSKVEYVNNSTKVCIICPTHGEFRQIPRKHLIGRGCPKCGGTNKLTTEEFIERARELHKENYDYSKTIYTLKQNKVAIICPIHGEFKQIAENHLRGDKCPKCAANNRGLKNRLTLSELLERFKKTHGNKYDYSNVEYETSDKKIEIICPIHGKFYQNVYEHQVGCGCPKCNASHLETKVLNLLKQNNIDNIYQASKKDFKWLNLQTLDFYVPLMNLVIECQGKQHFKSVDFFGGEEGFSVLMERDMRKNRLIIENGLNILYVVDNDVNIDLLDKRIYSNENTFHVNDIEQKIKGMN